MKKEQGGTTAATDDDTREIIINLNGFPTPKRNKKGPSGVGALPDEARRRNPPDAGDSPAWAEQIIERQSEDRRLREEERRQREQGDRMRALVAPLVEQNCELGEQLAARARADGQESNLAKQLREMREQQDRERSDALTAHLNRLEEQVRSATTPEG